MVPSLCAVAQATDVERERLSRAQFSDAASLVGLPLTERWIISGLHKVGAPPPPSPRALHTRALSPMRCPLHVLVGPAP